jgi:hypothetical protein
MIEAGLVARRSIGPAIAERSGVMRLPLSGLRLQEVDLLAALSPPRLEHAHEYLARGEPKGRLRHEGRLAGHLYGYQDHYTAYAEYDPAGSWTVGCSCDRRLPCAHVGALLLAWAREPESFRSWDTLVPALPDDPPWEWASGRPFPWAIVERARETDAQQPGPERFPHTLPRLLASVLGLPAGWWEVSTLAAAFREALDRAIRRAISGRDLLPWIAAARALPELPLAPLWRLRTADDDLVEAAFWRAWWDLRALYAAEPRPSRRLRLRAFAPHLADWLVARDRRAEALGLFSAVPDLDPYGLARFDWLFRHGFREEARETLLAAPVPPDPAGEGERRARLQLVSAGDDVPTPPPP